MRFEIEPLGDQVKLTVVHNGFGSGSAMLAGITEGWSSMDDETFLNTTADTLFELPGVTAVALGGSRAQDTARPDSDWDLAVYYRGTFAPQDLAAVGWPGQVSALGEWGGGIFNGGAWLTIDDRRVDVHYRDLDVVDAQLRAAEAGRFHIESLAFHLAGIPSYLVVAELAINRVLRGSLPRPAYPDALRRNAPPAWAAHADLTLDYAASNHAPHGRLTLCAGQIAVAATCFAHAASPPAANGSPTRKPCSPGLDSPRRTRSSNR